jgi:hypothetical protein
MKEIKNIKQGIVCNVNDWQYLVQLASEWQPVVDHV